MNSGLVGTRADRAERQAAGGLGGAGARILYLGGSGDPRAASIQAQLAAHGPFAVHWVSNIELVESLTLSGPVDLVVAHEGVSGAELDRVSQVLAPGAPIVALGPVDEPDSADVVRVLDGDIGIVEAVRYEILLHTLDRRNEATPTTLLGPVESEAFFEWDFTTDRVLYSDRWTDLIGGSVDDPTPDRWFSSVHPDDLNGLLDELETHLGRSDAMFEARYRMVDAAGSVRMVRLTAVVISDELGDPARMTGFVAPVDETAVPPASRDPLTGLADRASFLEQLAAVVDRQPDALCGVLVVGVDRFSWVNDSFGHAVGDQLLTGLAARLEDTVRPDDVVARLSGDEFAVLLSRLRDAASSSVAADRVLAAVREPFELDATDLDVSVSVGAATSASSSGTGEEILRQAAVAMQRAKNLGGSMAVLFDDDLEERASARLELEQDLRRAIERGALSVHYQPIVDLASGRTVSFEALVRWDHPERGPLSPAEFLPVAEESGLIVPLGELVLETSCRQLQRWSNEGLRDGVSVSVNVAAKQFAQSDLVEVVARALEQTGLRPDRLALEITESAFIDNVDAAATTLREVRRLGVRVYADDFGTGHASLNYLRVFPVDTIKIDRSFVEGLGSDDESMAFVRAIVGLGHSLGLGVIAEGVETTEQLELLTSLGCEEAQGYLFARPLPADAVDLS